MMGVVRPLEADMGDAVDMRTGGETVRRGGGETTRARGPCEAARREDGAGATRPTGGCARAALAAGLAAALLPVETATESKKASKSSCGDDARTGGAAARARGGLPNEATWAAG